MKATTSSPFDSSGYAFYLISDWPSHPHDSAWTFQADPKWVYLYRSKEMDVNPYRLEYVNETKEKFGIAVTEEDRAAVKEAFERHKETELASKRAVTLGWGEWVWGWLTWRNHA